MSYDKTIEKIEEFINNATEELGGSLDCIINNAGITKDNLLMRMSEEDFDAVIEINLKSVFNMTKAVQKIMLKNRKGSIINMSSVVGVKGNAGQANYAASKAGMIGFTKSIALELGSRNIRCNAIAPGGVTTHIMDDAEPDQEGAALCSSGAGSMPRMGESNEIAKVALFLASDDASFVNGETLVADGGWLAY